MNFKVGDRVKCLDADISPLYRGQVYTVRSVSEAGCFISLEGIKSSWSAGRFEKTSLETELRLCESRRGILSERIGEDQEEKKSLEKRIQELQQAIKERDKPKGRVGLKDSLNRLDTMYGISGDGIIFRAESEQTKQEYRALGNLFYDKESAERAVHDRKQRVLRGEGV